MKTSPDEDKMAAIADCLDADHDGKLRLDVLQKVKLGSLTLLRWFSDVCLDVGP